MRSRVLPLAAKRWTRRLSRAHTLSKRPRRESGRRPGEPGAVLYVGQSYYHAWYLSRELRRLGWTADVLDFDHNPGGAPFYHGHDFQLPAGGRRVLRAHLDFLE